MKSEPAYLNDPAEFVKKFSEIDNNSPRVLPRIYAKATGITKLPDLSGYEVEGHVHLQGNDLVALKGLPSLLKRDLIVTDNKLIGFDTLKGIRIKGNLHFGGNPISRFEGNFADIDIDIDIEGCLIIDPRQTATLQRQFNDAGLKFPQITQHVYVDSGETFSSIKFDTLKPLFEYQQEQAKFLAELQAKHSKEALEALPVFKFRLRSPKA